MFFLQGTPLKIGPFVRRNVEKRLRMNGPYINRWSEALVIQANPQYAPQSLELSLKLMDSIWHYAGCQVPLDILSWRVFVKSDPIRAMCLFALLQVTIDATKAGRVCQT